MLWQRLSFRLDIRTGIQHILSSYYRDWPNVTGLSRLLTKQTNWHVRPAKTQISLDIRPGWSESSLSAWRQLGSLATHWAHSEVPGQTGRMPRPIWVFAWRTCHFVGFVMRPLIILWSEAIYHYILVVLSIHCRKLDVHFPVLFDVISNNRAKVMSPRKT